MGVAGFVDNRLRTIDPIDQSIVRTIEVSSGIVGDVLFPLPFNLFSLQMGISLPFETGLNTHVTPDLGFEFHYFFMRKVSVPPIKSSSPLLATALRLLLS